MNTGSYNADKSHGILFTIEKICKKLYFTSVDYFYQDFSRSNQNTVETSAWKLGQDWENTHIGTILDGLLV